MKIIRKIMFRIMTGGVSLAGLATPKTVDSVMEAAAGRMKAAINIKHHFNVKCEFMGRSP